MLKNVMKKKLNKKGFTLAELLVVVAILAILVAVSIPIFTSQLNKARESTDAANERAAKAAVTSEFLIENMTAGESCYYDAANGTLVDTKPTTGYGQTTAHKNKVIKVTVADAQGKLTIAWE